MNRANGAAATPRNGNESMQHVAGVALGSDIDDGYRSSARSEVLALLPPHEDGWKILEIGCGEGAFCTSVPGSGEIWGIEPYEPAARVAAARLHKVFATTFENIRAELPLKYFDLVICNDVIEHITDHEAFLLAIQDHLAPGAHIVGSVPNVRFSGNLFNLIVARDWHYRASGVLDRTHFRFFTLRSLRRSLEGAGLDVRHLDGLNRGGVIGWTARAIAERFFRGAILVLSLGSARDIDFYQLGFLAYFKGHPPSPDGGEISPP